jgi:predicted ribosome quality control (RQC) complex YloA/Tae2 family protein
LLAVEGDLARVDSVEGLRRDAGLVLSNLQRLQRDTTHAELLDYTTDPPQLRALNIDRALGPQRQADAWFRRARKLERGAEIARARAQETRASIATLCALDARLAAAQDDVALAELASEAEKLGVRIERKSAKRGPTQRRERLPYREFVGTGERAIRVGRGPADNDRLTLDHARPRDLWLHARDEAGAHVVVPLARDETCPPALLCDAATLAAHFSKARGQARADVLYTPRRYVTKPRKAPAGLVSVLREKVFRLELEPARLERLLKSERGRLA